MTQSDIPERPFGNTGPEVTRVGLGGEGVLRTQRREEAAVEVIQEALTRGIGYCDSARVYADSELYYGSIWGERPELRDGVFQASKSASRDKDGALKDLEGSLQRLKTDHLDLWQIHDLRTEADLKAVGGPGGALSAFLEAKESGRVRHIGVTGHHDPRILTRAVKEWPVDSVMLPVNPVEGVVGGFLTDTLPEARQKGMAVIAMKILGASHYVMDQNGITAEVLIRYALSHDITVAIVGCSSPAEVQILANTGRDSEPLSAEEKDRLESLFKPHARRLAFYRGVI
jgi:aryl-alcohol dehydrogenase-like predicted oxidoreductase